MGEVLEGWFELGEVMNDTKRIMVVLAVAWGLGVPVSGQAPVNCKGPLALEQVVGLARNEVPETRLRQIVRECGVSFPLDSGTEGVLRAAGAGEGAIAAVRAAAPVNATPAEAAWARIRHSADPGDFREYLRIYPGGPHADLARQNLKAMEGASQVEAGADTATANASASPENGLAPFLKTTVRFGPYGKGVYVLLVATAVGIELRGPATQAIAWNTISAIKVKGGLIGNKKVRIESSAPAVELESDRPDDLARQLNELWARCKAGTGRGCGSSQ